jgi:hypothetical protein
MVPRTIDSFPCGTTDAHAVYKGLVLPVSDITMHTLDECEFVRTRTLGQYLRPVLKPGLATSPRPFNRVLIEPISWNGLILL